MLQDASKVLSSHERPGVLQLCGPSSECWGCEGTLRCPGKGASVLGSLQWILTPSFVLWQGWKIHILGFLLAMDLCSVPYFPWLEHEMPSSLCSFLMCCCISLAWTLPTFYFLSSFAFPLVVFHPPSSSSCYCPRLFMIVLGFYGISMNFISARLLEWKTSFFCLQFVWQVNFPTTSHVFHIFLSLCEHHSPAAGGAWDASIVSPLSHPSHCQFY